MPPPARVVPRLGGGRLSRQPPRRGAARAGGCTVRVFDRPARRTAVPRRRTSSGSKATSAIAATSRRRRSGCQTVVPPGGDDAAENLERRSGSRSRNQPPDDRAVPRCRARARRPADRLRLVRRNRLRHPDRACRSPRPIRRSRSARTAFTSWRSSTILHLYQRCMGSSTACSGWRTRSASGRAGTLAGGGGGVPRQRRFAAKRSPSGETARRCAIMSTSATWRGRSAMPPVHAAPDRLLQHRIRTRPERQRSAARDRGTARAPDREPLRTRPTVRRSGQRPGYLAGGGASRVASRVFVQRWPESNDGLAAVRDAQANSMTSPDLTVAGFPSSVTSVGAEHSSTRRSSGLNSCRRGGYRKSRRTTSIFNKVRTVRPVARTSVPSRWRGP